MLCNAIGRILTNIFDCAPIDSLRSPRYGFQLTQLLFRPDFFLYARAKQDGAIGMLCNAIGRILTNIFDFAPNDRFYPILRKIFFFSFARLDPY